MEHLLCKIIACHDIKFVFNTVLENWVWHSCRKVARNALPGVIFLKIWRTEDFCTLLQLERNIKRFFQAHKPS